MPTPPVLPEPARIQRRNAVTLKLLFIAGLVLVLLVPLHLVNALRQERSDNHRHAPGLPGEVAPTLRDQAPGQPAVTERAPRSAAEAASTGAAVFDAYRMVERAIKHGALVLALVFAAFFLFETLAGLRLHAVHYGLVGVALCLFYLALLALGEVVAPGLAYVGAAVASSALIILYSAAVLRAWSRAALIAGLLTVVHGVLYVVLRMEEFALLAGTATLFAAVAVVMFVTRNVDWYAHENEGRTSAEAVP
jgi:inner membrane protein involved in colicin E2 resistance